LRKIKNINKRKIPAKVFRYYTYIIRLRSNDSSCREVEVFTYKILGKGNLEKIPRESIATQSCN